MSQSKQHSQDLTQEVQRLNQLLQASQSGDKDNLINQLKNQVNSLSHDLDIAHQAISEKSFTNEKLTQDNRGMAHDLSRMS